MSIKSTPLYQIKHNPPHTSSFKHVDNMYGYIYKDMGDQILVNVYPVSNYADQFYYNFRHQNKQGRRVYKAGKETMYYFTFINIKGESIDETIKMLVKYGIGKTN